MMKQRNRRFMKYYKIENIFLYLFNSKYYINSNIVNNYIMDLLPHERCNFITDDKIILVGSRPEIYTFDKLIEFGITIFVNLEEDVNPWYKSNLEVDPKYKLISFPIKNGSVPSKSSILKLIEDLLKYWKNKEKIYIHCKGGHGRAGLVGALIAGFIYSFDAFEAIEYIEKCRMTRIDKSRNFIPTPETQSQVNFIVKILKLKDGHNPPERSDKSWLTIVKNERKAMKKINSANNIDSIYFYDKDDPYYEFSNFYLCQFSYNGIIYKSSEHAFQAAKYLHSKASIQNINYSEIIRKASTPNISRILGLQKISGGYKWRTKLNEIIKQSIADGVKIRDDWDIIKVELMQDILLHKFTQNEHCKQLLLMTGNKILVENSPRDEFWGPPLNMLGKILMNIRKILLEK